MGISKTLTSVAAAMIRKVLTENVSVILLVSMLWGNTTDEWVNIAQNDNPGIIGDECEWYPFQSLNSVPHYLLEIQTTPPLGYRVLTSAHESILYIPMNRVSEILKSVIDEIVTAHVHKSW